MEISELLYIPLFVLFLYVNVSILHRAWIVAFSFLNPPAQSNASQLRAIVEMALDRGSEVEIMESGDKHVLFITDPTTNVSESTILTYYERQFLNRVIAKREKSINLAKLRKAAGG